MSNNKQSSVEWLVEKIQQANPSFKFDALIRQAKEMEKQQKVETWSEAIDYSIMFLKDKTSKTSKEAFDEHYELTYGGDK
jgi:hypothetical protein